ncbi:hypothetical protein LOK49_LG04G02881 [Camellia lanceoleosa]|uniref:Uncharacterized protein n=1 Tax=Camellia lanceoleosa TaxID=1840588 RepID=A0ACC0HZL2_9ERIC|nr:hypothetical protein LOK49_LG04G02881 [Camellia lanceoleosa]
MSDTPASLLQSRVVEMGGKNGEADAGFSEPHLSQPIGGEVRGQAGPSEVLRSGSEHRMESDCGVNHPTVYQQGVSIISEPDLMGSFKESTIQALGSETAKDNTFSTPVGHGTTPSWSDSVEEEHNRFRDLPNSLDVARNRGEDRQLGDQGSRVVKYLMLINTRTGAGKYHCGLSEVRDMLTVLSQMEYKFMSGGSSDGRYYMERRDIPECGPSVIAGYGPGPLVQVQKFWLLSAPDWETQQCIVFLPSERSRLWEW